MRPDQANLKRSFAVIKKKFMRNAGEYMFSQNSLKSAAFCEDVKTPSGEMLVFGNPLEGSKKFDA